MYRIDNQIGIKANRYRKALKNKIPQLVNGCEFPDEISVTVELLNGEQQVYTLDDLKRGLKQCSPINTVIFRLNGYESLFPLYDSYTNKYDRLQRIKEFCTGRNIIVKMQWPDAKILPRIGLSRQKGLFKKTKWSTVSYATYLERIEELRCPLAYWWKEDYESEYRGNSIPFFCEPIYLWEITGPTSYWKSGKSKRQILVDEIFSYLESIDDFKDRLDILEYHINDFASSDDIVEEEIWVH